MSVLQKLLEINDEVVRTFAECEQLRSDQKTLQEICSIGKQRITELQAELRKACAERDEAVENAARLQEERDTARRECIKRTSDCIESLSQLDAAKEHARRLQAELDATRKQLQDVCSAEPAGQNDLVRDVSHYTETAEVDRPEQIEPQPVQVREGRWKTRAGDVRHVTPTPPKHDRADVYPWWDGLHTYRNDGRYAVLENDKDLVEYLGPIEPEAQPERESKPYTFAAYIVGDKSQPDALRIVWATEEWIQHSQFGIVHRMKDLQFFGNDGGCNITEYHETLTLYLEVQ